MLKVNRMAKGYSLILDKVPKELKLQLEIMKCKTTDELKEIDKEWFAHIDWDKFLELAMHHRVYSVIYQKMKQNRSNLNTRICYE